MRSAEDSNACDKRRTVLSRRREARAPAPQRNLIAERVNWRQRFSSPRSQGSGTLKLQQVLEYWALVDIATSGCRPNTPTELDAHIAEIDAPAPLQPFPATPTGQGPFNTEHGQHPSTGADRRSNTASRQVAARTTGSIWKTSSARDAPAHTTWTLSVASAVGAPQQPERLGISEPPNRSGVDRQTPSGRDDRAVDTKAGVSAHTGPPLSHGPRRRAPSQSRSPRGHAPRHIQP